MTFLIVASIFDIKSRLIPNWLIATGLITSLIFQKFFSYGYGLGFWASGLGTGFLCFLPLYILKTMGAGDVKLMALVGSFVGSEAALVTVALTLLAGGALAVVVMLWNKSWKMVFQNMRLMTTNMTIAAMTRQLPKVDAPVQSAGNLPYGVAIATGTLLYISFFRP